jgi:sigma-B regulation protein RsbU (phosphoserine phosphatase)
MSTVAQIAPSSLADVLPELEARQDLAMAMTEGVVVQDHEARAIWFNAAACRLLRLTPEQLIGSALGDQFRCSGTDGRILSTAELPPLVTLRTGQPVSDMVIGVGVNSLQPIWLVVSSTPTTRGGRPAVISVFRDVTVERHTRGELEETVAEINRTLIQSKLPSDSRIDFASEIAAISMRSTVGGDFLGAHRISPGRYGFFIGDVCGHGTQSAGVSALARHTVRTAGALLDSPGDVLSHLHDVLTEEWPDTFLTAICGQIESKGDTAKVRLAIAGHPRPILIRSQGARRVGDTGSLIGMVENEHRPVAELILRPGERLVLYTDGLTDTRSVTTDAVQLLSTMTAGMPSQEIATRTLQLGREAARWQDPDDDVAVLVVGFN